jgi:excisionase family DNA binding protein
MLLAESPESMRDLLRPLFEEFFATVKAQSSQAATDTLMSITDVCREFGISKTTLNEWKNKGIVPFRRLGRRVYFERDAVLEAGRSHTKYQHQKR